MATLIQSNQKTRQVSPKNGKQFTVEEIQELVGGYFEVIRSLSPRTNGVMLVNEEGYIFSMPLNLQASMFASRSIVGDVLIGSREEFGV